MRRECYEKLSHFPLDMPWSGDWYLWCLFALHYDVGYFAEPMVCYRDHSLSMTTKLTRESLEACAFEDVAIPWIMRKKAQEAGYARLAKDLLPAIAHTYARVIASKRYREAAVMTLQRCRGSLCRNIIDEKGTPTCFARVPTQIWAMSTDFAGYSIVAAECYKAALKINPFIVLFILKRPFCLSEKQDTT